MGILKKTEQRVSENRQATWKILGGEEALKEENKLAETAPPPLPCIGVRGTGGWG